MSDTVINSLILGAIMLVTASVVYMVCLLWCEAIIARQESHPEKHDLGPWCCCDGTEGRCINFPGSCQPW